MAAGQHQGVDNLASPNLQVKSKSIVFACLASLLVLSYVLFAREGGLLTTPESAIPASDNSFITPTVTSPALMETVTITVTATPTSASEQSIDLISLAPGGGNNVGIAPQAPRAVIIETSVIASLVPIMLHFSNVLGPAWGIMLFTLEETWTEPSSSTFQRALRSGHIEVRFLPKDTELTTSHGVSVFLTQPWIWEQLALAERILLFQADSIICTNSKEVIEDYFQYDFVGAPIDPAYGQGYNGGLSIRNPRLFLEVVLETNFSESGEKFEDQFFYKKLKERKAEMPTEDIAKMFSVETIYYETPMGYHQPQRWQARNMQAIETWCPEVKMLIGRRAT